VCRLGDHEVAPAAEHPDRFGLREGPPLVGVVRVDAHEAPFCLRDDLLGDDYDVACFERHLRGDQRREVVARRDLAEPGHLEDGELSTGGHRASLA